MSVLEHIKQLSANLSPQDKQALGEFLLLNGQTDSGERQLQSLRGLWQGSFPNNADIDATLNEIRGEWGKGMV